MAVSLWKVTPLKHSQWVADPYKSMEHSVFNLCNAICTVCPCWNTVTVKSIWCCHGPVIVDTMMTYAGRRMSWVPNIRCLTSRRVVIVYTGSVSSTGLLMLPLHWFYNQSAISNELGCQYYKVSIYRGKVWHNTANCTTISKVKLRSGFEITRDTHNSRAMVILMNYLDKVTARYLERIVVRSVAHSHAI